MHCHTMAYVYCYALAIEYYEPIFPNRIIQTKHRFLLDFAWIRSFFAYRKLHSHSFCSFVNSLAYAKYLLRPIFVGCDVTNQMNRDRTEKKKRKNKHQTKGFLLKIRAISIVWRHCVCVLFFSFGFWVNKYFKLHTFQ